MSRACCAALRSTPPATLSWLTARAPVASWMRCCATALQKSDGATAPSAFRTGATACCWIPRRAPAGSGVRRGT
eukprot:15140238-Alexandrium_andersonii.AAC.1